MAFAFSGKSNDRAASDGHEHCPHRYQGGHPARGRRLHQTFRDEGDPGPARSERHRSRLRSRRPAATPEAGLRGHPARRANAGDGRLRDRRTDSPATAIGGDPDHLCHRARPRRDRHGSGLRSRSGRLRLRPSGPRHHAGQGDRVRGALQGAAGVAAVSHSARKAGSGADYGDTLDPGAKDNLQRMRLASERMASVFDGLQTLFRLTSGQIHREQCDLSAMASEIVEEMRASSPERKLDVAIAEGMTASADPRLARILLTNLISNAWKFTAKSPAARVAIGTEIVDGGARMFVRDNGVGFDMIYAHKLFGAFQRLHSQSEFPGGGIGLATVRRIVNRHGGRTWAEGAVGEGATFYFVF